MKKKETKRNNITKKLVRLFYRVLITKINRCKVTYIKVNSCLESTGSAD